jgi:hypothetical protein
MILICLFSLFLGSFVAKQTNAKAQVASTTPIHAGDSWTGTDKSVGEYGNGSISKMTFKITSITATNYGYSMQGLLDGFNPAMKIYEGTYAQLSQYGWIPQEAINRWGKSPIDRYILIDIPHFAGLDMVEGRNGVLQGIEGRMGLGETDEFSLSKNITHPIKPSESWVTKTGFSIAVGKNFTYQAIAKPAHSSDPAIAHVNFTATWPGHGWVDICGNVTAHTAQNVYSCSTDFTKLNGNIPIPEGSITVTFNVTDTQSNVNNAPNGSIAGKIVYSTNAKADQAIAWAIAQMSSSITNQDQWKGNCEVFVENAYGTQRKETNAQKAFNDLHTSTSWTPDIGALVWFVPNAGNQNVGHVGIYIGGGQFISAIESAPGKQVIVVNTLTSWSANVAKYEGWGNVPSNWPGK